MKPEIRQPATKKSQPTSTPSKAITIPKTPRAVSRATRTAISLIQRDTPHSRQLKKVLAGISEGYQETIADKAVSEEAYRQYRELVGGQKKKQTADRRKLTQATVVTSATIIELREKRERIDALKTSREARRLTKTTTASSEVPGPAFGKRKKKKQHTPPGELLGGMSTIQEEEVEIVAGVELDKPLEDIEWEDNDSDGSEYKDSIQVISGGLEGLRVSGGHGGVTGWVLNDRSGTLSIDSTLRRSGRVSRSRE